MRRFLRRLALGLLLLAIAKGTREKTKEELRENARAFLRKALKKSLVGSQQTTGYTGNVGTASLRCRR
jgi:hypothetical protein